MLDSYSPFNKELGDLQVVDLEVLKRASEGWYIEYKQEVPKAASIAKSIAAFANTFGGWLFYGIAEKSKEDPTAGSFFGVEAGKVDGAMQTIRHAVGDQLNPVVYFVCKVLYGPCREIDLGADRAIICVWVGWSPHAPHVHKSGHVYRRVADGSEPVAETQRSVLDELWKRARNIRERYTAWVDRDPPLEGSEHNTPYIRLLITPDVWHSRVPAPDLTLEKVREVLGAEAGIVHAVPFDGVHHHADGYVGRQYRANSPMTLGMTAWVRHDLRVEYLIPLQLSSYSSTDLLRMDLREYKYGARYVAALERSGIREATVLDLNHFLT